MRSVEQVAVDDARTAVLSTLVVPPARAPARARRARARRRPAQRAVPRPSARRALVGQRSPAPPHHRQRARAGQPAAHAQPHARDGAPRAAPQRVPPQAQRHHRVVVDRPRALPGPEAAGAAHRVEGRAPRARGRHGRRLRRAARGPRHRADRSRRCCAARRSPSCSTRTPARRRCTGKTPCSCSAMPSSRARSRIGLVPDAAPRDQVAGPARLAAAFEQMLERAPDERRRPRGRRVPRAPLRAVLPAASSTCARPRRRAR